MVVEVQLREFVENDEFFLNDVSSRQDDGQIKFANIEFSKWIHSTNSWCIEADKKNRNDSFRPVGGIRVAYLDDGTINSPVKLLTKRTGLRTVELEFWITKKYRGKGVMRSALDICISRFLSQPQIKANQLAIIISEENLACRRFAERYGFQRADPGEFVSAGFACAYWKRPI